MELEWRQLDQFKWMCTNSAYQMVVESSPFSRRWSASVIGPHMFLAANFLSRQEAQEWAEQQTVEHAHSVGDVFDMG